MFSLHALAVVIPFFLQAFSQFTQVCDPGNGLCFNQAFDEATKSTFGFTLPTKGTFSDDFIAKVITPLPYGFVGFGIGNTSEIPQLSIDGLMTQFTSPGPIGALQTAMLVQQTALSADGTQLVPTPSGGRVTVSKLSTWNDTWATFVFRCQNCSQAVPVDDNFNIVVFQSYELPIYATPDALNATVNTAAAEISGFTINNISALTSTNYASYLNAAGFV
ncbi:hypothetical protein B0H14DRAFT_3146353 [Mycena olivaceomarginata]|nr:hypothetical protein B0H14DRAFT_3146353 [Mycena olivaceomarginata]